MLMAVVFTVGILCGGGGVVASVFGGVAGGRGVIAVSIAVGGRGVAGGDGVACGGGVAPGGGVLGALVCWLWC